MPRKYTKKIGARKPKTCKYYQGKRDTNGKCFRNPAQCRFLNRTKNGYCVKKDTPKSEYMKPVNSADFLNY